jgi:long-chain-alcohol oxidase
MRCGTCPTGCAIDAKQAMHVSELPRAVAAGARIRAGARVTHILVSGGRAVGVQAANRERVFSVRARAVVLAGGAVGTPELLLRQGLTGGVGRNLHVQPACWVGARFDDAVRGWDGVMQSWHVDEWRQRGLFLEATFTPLPFGAHWLPGVGAAFKERVADIGKLAVIGVHLADASAGRVRIRSGAARLGYRLTAEDAATLGFGIARAADILFAAGACEVYPQVAGTPSIGPGEQGRLEAGMKPARLRLEAFHPMGTAAMGSVTDASGELRELPGAYVADGSLLPTAPGVSRAAWRTGSRRSTRPRHRVVRLHRRRWPRARRSSLSGQPGRSPQTEDRGARRGRPRRSARRSRRPKRHRRRFHGHPRRTCRRRP